MRWHVITQKTRKCAFENAYLHSTGWFTFVGATVKQYCILALAQAEAMAAGVDSNICAPVGCLSKHLGGIMQISFQETNAPNPQC